MNFELLSNIKTKYIGVYKKEKIVDLCDTLLKENFNGNEEIPSVYIVRTLESKAGVINSLILNFVKGLNSIIISRELLSYLNIKELKSIIAHEIGHFKKYLSIAKRISFIPSLFVILGSYIVTSTLIPIIGIYDLFLYLICFILIKLILTWPFKIYKHDKEFLSDLYSAEKYGKLNMINALIKIYQMNNIDTLLNIEISKFIMDSDHLQIKNFKKIKRKIKKKLSKKIYDENLIVDQIKTQLKGMNFKNKKVLSEKKIKKRNQALKKYLKNLSKIRNNKTINWEDVDTNIRDGRIDLIEYEGFIETLKNNPDLQLFTTPKDNNRKMKFGTHPSLRARILFIDQNCSNLERQPS